MTTEQLERERREESLRQCRESEKAVKVRMRGETVVFLMNAEQQDVDGYPA